MFDFLQGKKTYIILAAFLVLAVLTMFLSVEVPEEIWPILVALGVGAIRSAMTAISGNKGWKTYLAVVATLVMSVCQYLGIALPFEIIYTILAALGVVGVRDAVKKLE